MFKMTKWLMLSFFSCANISQANPTATEENWIKCKDAGQIFENFGNIDLQVIQVSNQCLLNISDGNEFPLYRRFLFNESGDIIIFNSFGQGTNDTGARGYMLLPREHDLQFRSTETDLIIKTPSGIEFVFNKEIGTLTATNGINFSLADNITGTNNGGVELTPISGIMLDEGWKRAELPRTNKNKNSTFKDALGNSCIAKNIDIFDYYYDEDGIIDSVKFKFTDIQLKEYLAQNCPQLVY